jgi:hypothetical protein
MNIEADALPALAVQLPDEELLPFIYINVSSNPGTVGNLYSGEPTVILPGQA